MSANTFSKLWKLNLEFRNIIYYQNISENLDSYANPARDETERYDIVYFSKVTTKSLASGTGF